MTTWTVAHEAPLLMEFSRQVYWGGLPFLPPGDLPDPGRLVIFYQAIWEQKIEHREANAVVFKDMVPDTFYYWVLRYVTNFFSP